MENGVTEIMKLAIWEMITDNKGLHFILVIPSNESNVELTLGKVIFSKLCQVATHIVLSDIEIVHKGSDFPFYLFLARSITSKLKDT